MKLCPDCRYHVPERILGTDFGRCTHPRALADCVRYLADGRSLPFCSVERSPVGLCKKAGKLWEPNYIDAVPAPPPQLEHHAFRHPWPERLVLNLKRLADWLAGPG